MKKSKMQSYTSEYCLSGGDNAASREQIDNSIISKATTNEGEFVKAMQEGINNIGKK